MGEFKAVNDVVSEDGMENKKPRMSEILDKMKAYIERVRIKKIGSSQEGACELLQFSDQCLVFVSELEELRQRLIKEMTVELDKLETYDLN